MKAFRIAQIALWLVITLCGVNANAQVGKEFWFVAPDVSYLNGDEPIALRFTAFDNAAKVTVSMPANPAFTPIVVNVAARTQVTVRSDNAAYSGNFNVANVENKPVNTVNKNGLLVTSTENISAYYEVLNIGNPEIFTLKAENGLGTTFFVPSQNEFNNRDTGNSSYQSWEQINIVASDDQTTVTIAQPTGQDLLYGYVANQPITITLNKGQTFCVRSKDRSNTASLAGIKITSDKNVAVTISDDAIKFSSGTPKVQPRDLVGDQLIPIDILGTEYVSIRTGIATNDIDMVFILAVEDGTYVYIDANTPILLNAGQQYSYNVTKNTYIRSSKPVYVYQLAGLRNQNDNELGSAILPPIGCTGSRSVSFTRNFASTIWVQLMVQYKNINGFKMYDNAGNEVNYLSGITWQKVAATDKGIPGDVWYIANIDLSVAPRNISQYTPYVIENSLGLFHLSVKNINDGEWDKETTGLNYGYFSAYSTVKIVGPSFECNGNTITLESKDPSASIYWQSLSTGTQILSTSPTFVVDRTDRFYLTTTNSAGCSATDSIDVTIDTPPINFPDTLSFCPGDPAILTVPTGYTNYTWSDPSYSGTTVVLNGGSGTNQAVWVQVTDIQGCTNRDTVNVVVHQSPVINLLRGNTPLDINSEFNICMGDTIFNATTLDHYKWELNGVILPTSGNYIVPKVGGTYKVTAWSADSCSTSQDVVITISPQPSILLADKTGCFNQPMAFDGPVGMTSYLWSDGSTLSQYTATQPSTFWLEVVDANGCSARDTVNYAWYPKNSVEITYTTGAAGSLAADSVYFCPENPIVLTASPTTYNTYTWCTGETATSSISVLVPAGQQKSVWLEVTDANSCIWKDTVDLVTYPSPTVDLTKVPSAICLGDTIFNTTQMERYQWEVVGQPIDAANNKTYFVPTQTGTYEVRLTTWNAENCSVTESKTITVNPLPVIGLADVSVCPHTPALLNGPLGMVGYLWADGSTGAQYTASAAGDVWLKVVDANGCISQDTATVSWYPQPKVDLSYYSSVIGADIQPDEVYTCPESPVTLTATPGFSYYLWNIDANEQNNAVTTAPPVGGATQVWVEVTDINGCSARDTIDVIANPTPVVDMSHIPSQVCVGDTLKIDDLWRSYQWQTGTDPIDPAQNRYYLVTTQSGTFDFKVTVTNASGCGFTASKTVTVNALPVIGLADKTVCPHTPAVFDGPVGMVQYLWGDNTTNAQYTANAEGKVWLRVVDANGCVSKDSANVSWYAQPSVEIGYYSSVIGAEIYPKEIYTCPESPVTLSATAGFAYYLWSIDGNERSNTIAASVPIGGQTPVYLEVTDANGCLAHDTLTVMANPTPVIDMSTVPNQVCVGDTLSIADTWEQYQWQMGTNPANPADNQNYFVTTQSGTFDFSVTVWNTSGCMSTQTKSVVVNALPVIGLSDVTVCPNSSVVFDGPAGMQTYQWGDGTTLSQFTTQLSGQVWLQVKDMNGCVSKDSANVIWHAQPIVNLSYFSTVMGAEIEPDTIYTCPENPALIKATAGFSSYVWSHDASVTGNTTQVAPPVGGEVQVSVLATDANGCVAADTIRVIALEVPDAVLPLMQDNLCVNAAISISPIKDQIFKHQWSLGGTTSTKDNFTPTIGGGLVLTVWNEFGCSASKTITVHEPTITLTDAGNQASECHGASHQFEVVPVADYSYFWNDHTSTGTTYTATTPGTYWVEAVHDLYGCKTKASASFTWHPGQLFNFNDKLSVCQDGFEYEIKGDPLMTDYTWYKDGALIPEAQGNNLYVQNDFSNPYYDFSVSAKYPIPNSTEYCPITQNFRLDVVAQPEPLNLNDAFKCGEEDFHGKTINVLCICEGSQIELEGYNDFRSYKWYRIEDEGTPSELAVEISGATDRFLVVTTPGLYQLEAYQTDCVSLGTVRVNINPNPVINLVADKLDICEGDNFTLENQDADAASHTYAWTYNGETIVGNTTPLLTGVSHSGNYAVTATATNTCVSKASVSISAPTTPDISLLNELRCSNEALSLQDKWTNEVPAAEVTKAVGHKWFLKASDGSLTEETNASVTNAAGDYIYVLQVDVQDNPSAPVCSFFYNFRLIVKQAPVFDLGIDRAICEETSTVLNPDNSFPLYKWTGAFDGNSAILGSTYSLTVDKADTYQLQVWNNFGCTEFDHVGVTINPKPTLNLTLYKPLFCEDEDHNTINLENAGLFTNVLWGTGVADDGKPSIDVTKHGNYTVTATLIATGCTNSKAIAVDVFPKTIVTLPKDRSTICANQTETLVSPLLPPADVQSYRWYYGAIDAASPQGNIDSPWAVNTAGDYVLSVKDLNGCSASANFKLNVSEAPVFTLGADQTICDGTSTTLTSDKPFPLYKWSLVGDPVTVLGSQLSLPVTNAGDYQLQAWNSFGCSETDAVNVAVNPLPTLLIDPVNDLICEGESSKTITLTNAVDFHDIAWSNGETNVPSITVMKSGVYTVQATDNITGCTNSATSTINAFPKTTIVLTDTEATICANQTYLLTSPLTPPTDVQSYQWYFNNVDPASPQGNPDQPWSVNSAGNYVLFVKDINGCSASANFKLNVSVAPVFDLGLDQTICDGLTATLQPNSAFTLYKWTNVVNPTVVLGSTHSLNVSLAGTYQLQAWNEFGCSEVDQSSVFVNPKPTLIIDPINDLFCEGETSKTITLQNAANFTNILWSNGAVNAASITVSKSGIYTVSGADVVTGCVNEASSTLNAYPKTTIVLPETEKTICANEWFTLVSPLSVPADAQSYQWYYQKVDNTSPKGNLNQPWTVNMPGTYILVVTDLYGCTATATFTLTVHQIPLFSLGADKVTCQDIAATLDAGASFPIYKWTNLGNLSETFPNTQTVDVYNAGVYQLQAWLSNGCTNYDTVAVAVNPKPVFELALAKDSICKGEPFAISIKDPTGLHGFVWSTGETGVSSITVTQPSTYSVRAFDANNCYNDVSVSLLPYHTTKITLTDQAVCANETIVLPSFAEVPVYQWYFGSIAPANLLGDQTAPISVNTGGKYIIHGSDLNGCTVSASMNLAVKAVPLVDLGPDRVKCFGDTVTLSSKSNYANYMWNGVDIGTQHYMVIQTQGSQTIMLEVTNSVGCKGSDQLNLTVNALPTIDLGADQLVCPGTVTTLTAITNAPNLVWSTKQTTPSIDVLNGTYWAKAIDANGCEGKDVVTVDWRLAPQPVLGPTEMICPNTTLLLDAGSGYTSYRWHNGAQSQTITANIADTLNMVVVTDTYGCEGWDSKLVYHFAFPDYYLAPDTAICANLDFVLDAGPDYPFFLWDDGSTDRYRTVNQEGSYWVEVSDGCVWARDTMNVSFLPMPYIKMLDTMVYAQISVLADGGIKPYQYSANGGNMQDANVFKRLVNGTYEMMVQDANGCFAIDTVSINSVVDIDIPNFFTPNGDGFNDKWRIAGMERFPEAEIVIFDRYGKLLVKLNGDSDGWDGRFMGKPMPSDDYWFVVHLVHVNKTIRGNITLKR